MLVTVSRIINVCLGGRYECLCSRAYRRGWVGFVLTADALFYALRGETDHCRRLHEWESGFIRNS